MTGEKWHRIDSINHKRAIRILLNSSKRERNIGYLIPPPIHGCIHHVGIGGI